VPDIDDSDRIFRNAHLGSKRALLEYYKSLGATDESLVIVSRWDDSFETIVNALLHYKRLRELAYKPNAAEAELVRLFALDRSVAATLVSGRGYGKQRAEAAHRRKLQAQEEFSHYAVGNPTTPWVGNNGDAL
jgi:hypothetical protein